MNTRVEEIVEQFETSSEILTVEEAARFLRVTRRTIYDHVERRAIPHLRVGRLIRFQKPALIEWAKREGKREDEL